MSISPPINSRRAPAGRMEMRWAGGAGTVSLLTSVGFGEGLRRSLSVNPPLRPAIYASGLNRWGRDGGQGAAHCYRVKEEAGGRSSTATDLFQLIVLVLIEKLSTQLRFTSFSVRVCVCFSSSLFFNAL